MPCASERRAIRPRTQQTRRGTRSGMGNLIAVRPCCNVMAVKIGPAPFNRPRTNGRIRVTAARARRGRLLHHCGRSQPLMGSAVYAPQLTMPSAESESMEPTLAGQVRIDSIARFLRCCRYAQGQERRYWQLTQDRTTDVVWAL